MQTMSRIKPKKVLQDLGIYGSPEEGRSNYIRLDFNENTDPIAVCGYSSYPEYKSLLAGLSAIYNVPEENLIATNGTDEALFLIANTFIEPGSDSALVSKPTFDMIYRGLLIAGADLIEVPVKDDLSYNIDALAEVLSNERIKVAIFASPDNPTGSVIDLDIIEGWCKKYKDTLFVMDEAYAEYAGIDAIPLTRHNKNLLVTRTFSKAWGIAGLRLGVIIGDSELLSYITSLKMPYSVNACAVSSCVDLVEMKAAVLEAAKATMVRKARLLKELTELGLTYTEGYGNFFLLDTGDCAQAFCDYLKDGGILVRNRSTQASTSPTPIARSTTAASATSPSENKVPVNIMHGKVRISIGTDEENKELLETIKSWLEKNPPAKT